MKLSLEWLGQFVEWVELDPTKIADALTLSTAEVEEVLQQGELIKDCIVAKVTSVSQHPNADKLLLAEVDTGSDTVKVVCGGTNVKEGMLVAFAPVGATVKWHGEELMTLAPVKIRGEKSEGMICAAEELGLEDMFPAAEEDGERPIIDVSRSDELRAMSNEPKAESQKLKAGQPLREALNLTDTILDINNTAITTRPDLFSHLGFAREVVALGLAKWRADIELPPMSEAPATEPSLSLTLDCPELVPRYLSIMLSIDEVGTTPDWMKKRLAAVGIRSLSLPVDITNYVMMEIGVPMHSFDADDLKGAVHMRLSKKGEELITLDGKKHTLPEGALVMSDKEGVFDLLGIMGGLRSSTKEGTKNVYLHALSLDPATIRHAITETGHRTDAATIYEKQVPPVTTEIGFNRAVQLFLELVPGARIVSKVDSHGTNGDPAPIELSLDRVRSTLGMNISDDEIVSILEKLEFSISPHKNSATQQHSNVATIMVTPPLHRLRDIEGAHDLIEEVGRMKDFNTIEPFMPLAALNMPARDMRMHTLRRALAASGYNELLPLSFISPKMLERTGMNTAEAIKVQNPLGEDTSLMRTHTLPALLQHAEEFLPQAERALCTFQWGHVFKKDTAERSELTMMYTAKTETTVRTEPFLLVKQALFHALESTGYTPELTSANNPEKWMHPGRTVTVTVDGKTVGTLYEIHPSIRKNFDLPHRTAAATIDIDALLAIEPRIKKEAKGAQYPSVIYDETMKRTALDPIGPVLKKMKEAAPLLEDVSVHDIYPQENGAYNLTLRFTYRSPEKTLTEEEAKKAHEKAMQEMH